MSEQFFSVKSDTGTAILCGACAADLIDLEEAQPLRLRSDYTCEACDEAIHGPRDEDYERAVAHARSNDYEDFGGRDVT